MDKSIKIKLSKNEKVKGALSDFTISYSSKKLDKKSVSNKIISALKGDDNIFIEIDSSLMTLDENNKDYLHSRLTDAFEHMGLAFIDKKISYDKKRSFLSIPIESKKIEGYRICVYADNNSWNNRELADVIPEHGVRYYISGLFNDLGSFTATDEGERLDKCSMVIFDHVLLGSMGISSSKSKEEVKSLLNNNLL
ncbi:hypothetical protein [Ruminiclostridium cellulolyticum]|uniref:Uncharacterized protein n=1 Tax=Ruminiclostridium cellulolyticum (strain ATCC 35319 / DSM 5812 / JCM 6584 / H10) TaxID=394503 RepID=B8I1X4_RUMCH|nr:hypothetical protein [Ruminiclostridium cellulolyticum]ACL75800.1 hypothetical protein Ccel_1446 [Ruminiclostridium cellulolyticum H10]